MIFGIYIWIYPGLYTYVPIAKSCMELSIIFAMFPFDWLAIDIYYSKMFLFYFYNSFFRMWADEYMVFICSMVDLMLSSSHTNILTLIYLWCVVWNNKYVDIKFSVHDAFLE